MKHEMNSMLESALGSKPKAAHKVKDERKHGYAKHVIHHHHDGTHHIEAHPINGGEPMIHGAQDMNGLHDQLEENLGGQPSQEEMAAVQGEK